MTSKRTFASRAELHVMRHHDEPCGREPNMNRAGMDSLLFFHKYDGRRSIAAPSYVAGSRADQEALERPPAHP
jgi:hypothetical protein